MSEEKIHITTDSREVNSGIPAMLGQFPDVELSSAQLDIGDYVLAGGRAVVERKDVNDFAASIMDGRLFTQVALMRANFDVAFVLLEGDVQRVRSEIAVESLQGAISYLAWEGCQVIHSPSQEFSAGLLRTMAKHQEHGLGYEVPMRSGKPKDLQKLSQFLVEGLSGVGPGRAIKLLEHFGSAGRVFGASVKELSEAPGIGAKSAQKIYESIHLVWQRR